MHSDIDLRCNSLQPVLHGALYGTDMPHCPRRRLCIGASCVDVMRPYQSAPFPSDREETRIFCCSVYGFALFCGKGEAVMSEKRISVVSIIVEDREAAAAVNSILHEYADMIVGRMGLPYRERKVSIICVVLDAAPDAVSALSGKLGMVPGVQSKTVTAKNNS